jgi:hypothetical protein
MTKSESLSAATYRITQCVPSSCLGPMCCRCREDEIYEDALSQAEAARTTRADQMSSSVRGPCGLESVYDP